MSKLFTLHTLIHPFSLHCLITFLPSYTSSTLRRNTDQLMLSPRPHHSHSQLSPRLRPRHSQLSPHHSHSRLMLQSPRPHHSHSLHLPCKQGFHLGIRNHKRVVKHWGFHRHHHYLHHLLLMNDED